MPITSPLIRQGLTTGLLMTSLMGFAQEDHLIQTDPRSILTAEVLSTRRTVVTSIADMEAKDVSEAPANVQVITARQIEASGARDLLEALQLVPGISIGRDVDDVVGVGIHGNWAEEGKCLFLLNGTQLNENDFGTYAIGQRIPLDNVERIEVIMGPGSIVHGGFAALGVVNIVTYTAEQKIGSGVTFRTGLTERAVTRNSITASGTHRLGTNQEVGYQVSHLLGYRSNAAYALPDGSMIDLHDSTQMNASSFQFTYRWKELKTFMNLMNETFDVSDGAYCVQMRDVNFGLEHTFRLGERGNVQWRLTQADQMPWYYIDTEDVERLASNTANQRTSFSSIATLHPARWLTLRFGVQAARQHSAYRMHMEQAVFRMNDRRDVDMYDVSALGEATAQGKWGHFTMGHRIQRNSLSGVHTAPRIAYTMVLGKAHFKAMWSKAFRIPTVMNLNYGPEGGDVTPERITTTEAEVGLQLGAGTSIHGNVYHTRINNPIVYVFDEATLDNYVNRGLSGTEGVDARLLREQGKWIIQAGLGLNRALAEADIPEAQLPDGIGHGYQGLPTGRAFASASWSPAGSITARVSASWRDRIWYCELTGADGIEDQLVEWDEQWLVNAGITLRPGRNKRWSMNLGCYNMLDQAQPVLSPFDNHLLPFRLNGREYTANLIINFVQ